MTAKYRLIVALASEAAASEGEVDDGPGDAVVGAGVLTADALGWAGASAEFVHAPSAASINVLAAQTVTPSRLVMCWSCFLCLGGLRTQTTLCGTVPSAACA
ncbi:hypothetical protein JCM18899A_14560 [Nocardioides sp. AN3]